MSNLLTFVISTVFDILQILILIRVFLSWIPHDPHNQFSIFLLSVTEPINEKWLEVNKKYSEIWPNISVKKEPLKDHEKFKDEKDKFNKYFEENI